MSDKDNKVMNGAAILIIGIIAILAYIALNLQPKHESQPPTRNPDNDGGEYCGVVSGKSPICESMV